MHGIGWIVGWVFGGAVALVVVVAVLGWLVLRNVRFTG